MRAGLRGRAGRSGAVRFPRPAGRPDQRRAGARFLRPPWPRTGLHGVCGADCAPAADCAERFADAPGGHPRADCPHPLAAAPVRGSAKPVLLPERLRRPHCQPHHADRRLAARIGRADRGRAVVRQRLHRQRAVFVRAGGLAADAAAGRVGVPVCRCAGVLRAAGQAPLLEGLRSALPADGSHRRRLHEHRHAQAVRAHPPGRRLRGRSGAGERGKGPQDDPHDHGHGRDPDRAQRTAGRGYRRAGAVAMAPGPDHGRGYRTVHRAGDPHREHVRLDHVGGQRHLRGYRHRAGRHGNRGQAQCRRGCSRRPQPGHRSRRG